MLFENNNRRIFFSLGVYVYFEIIPQKLILSYWLKIKTLLNAHVIFAAILNAKTACNATELSKRLKYTVA